MSQGYSSHAEYMKWVVSDADERQKHVEKSLQTAFSNFIQVKRVKVIVFTDVTAADLAKAMIEYPVILKPILAACNIAARAIERDLSIKNVDTYNPKLTRDQANILAGYIKPFLPVYMEIPTLSRIDRISFIDKEVRKRKGQWERKIIKALNKCGNLFFKKRTFTIDDEQFEIDAAYPETDDIKIAIDIKRIESRRDIHKRCDEIVNKAFKLKKTYKKALFAAVIYYPFIDEHINIQSRLRSENIDQVVFASEAPESIKNTTKLLLSCFGDIST